MNSLKHSKPNKTIQGLNAFVDISHHNEQVDLSVAKNAGLVGFFHKATQGVDFEDPKYGERIQIGKELGLLMGAYHFGTADPVETQVDTFTTSLQKYGIKGIVPVLDWEPNSDKKQGTMSREQAIQFIELLYQKTGVYPMIYGGYWILLQLADEKNTETFSKAPLWQGFYSASLGYLDGIWDTWSFWQYTDGVLGPEPHEMAGIGTVDKDTFNGSYADAVAFWQKHAPQ